MLIKKLPKSFLLCGVVDFVLLTYPFRFTFSLSESESDEESDEEHHFTLTFNH